MNQMPFPVVRPPARRYRLAAAATLICDGRAVPVELRDISTEGLKLATATPPAAGAAVQLRLPDGSMVAATVRWTREGLAGLRFAADLPEDRVRDIAERD